MSNTTPLTAVDTELDKLLESVAVKSANQYGGFEGWDDEADKEEVIGESREAIKALIGTIAEQIRAEEQEKWHGIGMLWILEQLPADTEVALQAEAVPELEMTAGQAIERIKKRLSTPAPQDGSVTTEAPERLKDYMENKQ